MKRIVLMALMAVGIVGSASAQRDDLYFVPKKKKVVEEVEQKSVATAQEKSAESKTLTVTTVPARQLEMDEDTYNRRGSYLTEQGDAVSEFAMDDEGFVLITEEGDTMWMDTDTLRLTRVTDGEGWVSGFDGSDSDYEYAMRIIRFRNPRYAIPVSSPLYWDVVYGSALWPRWDWNIYDDGMYAYVFPTSSNWHYWDYRMSYPFGWSAWSSPWNHHYGCHWGHHWGSHSGWQFYGHVWYDPWFNPYFFDYNPGWHHGHHHGHYPHFGIGKPGWGGGGPKVLPNTRKAVAGATRQEKGESAGRSTASSSRTGVASNRTGTERRIDNGSDRNTSVRVVTGGAVRSSTSNRTSGSEVVRRSTGSSSVSRGTAAGSSSRSSSTVRSTSRSSSSSSSGSSYSRPSSTRSSSSSSTSRSSSSSSSSRSSSYSSGSSSRSSSYSSGSSSYSSGSSSRSSYSGGSSSHSSYSGGGSSRSSYSGSSSSRSSGGRR